MPEIDLLRPSLFRTLSFVALAALALIVVDGSLARTERTDTAMDAVRSFAEGQRLMQAGNYDAAADSFRSAIANARDNPQYPLALGQAQLAAGRLDAAENTLTDLLKADSMSGPSNLAMARVFAKEGRYGEAASYYHRAIYGQWSQDLAANQVMVRFELARLFAARNLKPDLLAELLPLEDQAPTNPETQHILARLYLTAGSPARAATIFHNLLRTRPDDAEALKGLGDADFARGSYASAQADYMATLRLQPDNNAAKEGLELSDRVLDLDPLRRGLPGADRFERSLRVLELVAAKIPQCTVAPPVGPTADLISAADAALKRHVPVSSQPEAVESNLELANKLWQAERSTCTAPVSLTDQPLQLVLTKSGQ